MKKNLNWTYIIIAIILGAAIASYGGLNYITKQNQLSFEKQQKQKEEETKTAELKKDIYRQVDLDNCLKKAEDNFSSLLELNSYSAPQEGYPDARVWDNSQISEEVQQNLRKDKEICVHLYGSKN